MKIEAVDFYYLSMPEVLDIEREAKPGEVRKQKLEGRDRSGRAALAAHSQDIVERLPAIAAEVLRRLA